MKKTWICLVLLLAMALPACKKVLKLDRGDQGGTTPINVEDFEQILNNPGICAPKDFTLLEMVTDDAFLPVKNLSEVVSFYVWGQDPWSQWGNDNIYNQSYKWIAQMNLVIQDMPRALPVGQFSDRRALAVARAKINRAYFYLMLVNTYGKHYQTGSASTDLAVPLILEVSNQVSKPRATVEQVYQQILTDLKDALATPLLPNESKDFIVYPSRAGALALLARTYLYMGNYPLAEKAASDALAINSNLASYLTYDKPGTADGRKLSLLEQASNPEVLLARVEPLGTVAYIANVNPELLSLFDKTKDKRVIASIITNPDGSMFYRFGLRGTDLYFNYSIGVPEMMLIKAECLARANDAAGAVNLLNTLLAKRITGYTNQSTSISADAALNLVLLERRRELMSKGHRLFDLKRLNLEARFKTDIVRKNSKGEVVFTLPAGSPNYVFPFSPPTLNANKSLEQNPRVAL